MRHRFRTLGIACAALLISRAAMGVPRQFDLVCRGNMADRAAPGPSHPVPKPFTSRIRIDLASRRICLDDCAGVFHISKFDGTVLEYHYNFDIADEDHPAHSYRNQCCRSTAGPFPSVENVVVNLRTGGFRRTYEYRVGDRVSWGHDESYSGTCSVDKFSGYPKTGSGHEIRTRPAIH